MKISIQIISVILISIALHSCAQPTKKEFIGKITYSISVESKTPNATSAEIQSMYGDTMVSHIKNGNFKYIYNGMGIQQAIYLKSTNTEYDIIKDKDTLYTTDWSKEDRPLTSSEISEDAEDVLGRKCKKITHTISTTKNEYWYDESIYVPADNFKQAKFSHTNVYYEKAQSPYIKFKYTGNSFILTLTAIDIEEMPIDDSIFELPNYPQKVLE
ncbi:MAG: hypothetical protein M0D57_01095 [Sphingobacteriales bacterium JAD_PAG50586_3]|nr:MAG: hypothetical protein M0D57_01095 [Sphingobacteriales bacterium JAD_PAG50586_3]